MKLNTDKCHLLISGHKYEHKWTQIVKDRVWGENKVKLLGITIDNELKYDSHVLNTCSKANKDSSKGYPISRFLKHSLNIALRYGCSVVDPPITKSTSLTKQL